MTRMHQICIARLLYLIHSARRRSRSEKDRLVHVALHCIVLTSRLCHACVRLLFEDCNSETLLQRCTRSRSVQQLRSVASTCLPTMVQRVNALLMSRMLRQWRLHMQDISRKMYTLKCIHIVSRTNNSLAAQAAPQPPVETMFVARHRYY